MFNTDHARDEQPIFSLPGYLPPKVSWAERIKHPNSSVSESTHSTKFEVTSGGKKVDYDVNIVEISGHSNKHVAVELSSANGK